MKKIIILLFMTVSSLSFIFTTDIYAYSVDYYKDEINQIENELMAKNKTVQLQLNTSINDYKVLLNNSSYNSLKINAIIENLQKARDKFNLYKSDTGAQTPALIYVSAVIAAVAYFELLGYKLSSELLLFSIYNESQDTEYEPVNKYIVCHSKFYKNEAFKTNLTGSIAFEKNEVDNIENDCFFSLHNVLYTKDTSSSRDLNIEDVYDYNRSSTEFDGIVQVAVNLMADAMAAGYITSYHIKFNPGIPHTNYEYVYVSSYKHSLICKDCDIKKDLVSHTYNIYNKYDQDRHKAICPCGVYELEAHTWIPARLNAIKGSNNIYPNYVPGYKCKYCGQTKYSEEV